MTVARPGVLVALLLAATAGVFSSTLRASFVWDDTSLIPHNKRLQGDGAWSRAFTDEFWEVDPPMLELPVYWRPVVKLSHVALWKAGGGDPFPFHLVNLLLHLGCVALAFAWLQKRLALQGEAAGAAVLGAFAGAALFAVHTTRFESVPWISGATDIWMTLFVLAAAVTVRTRAWWLAAPLTALGVLSKETAAVFPVLLLLDGVLAPAQRLPWRRWLAIAVGTVTPLILRFAMGIGFPDPPDHGSIFDRVSRVLGAVGGYHVRLLPLTPTTQPFEISRTQHGVWQVPGWLMAVGAVAMLVWLVAILFWKRTRVQLANACWWLLPLGPLLQVKTVPSVTFCSDRFQYLPLLGVCALLASAMAWALRDPSRSRPFSIALTGVLGACALQLLLAVPAFESNDTLMRREYELRPDSAVAITNYAITLEVRSNWRAALRLRRHALDVSQPPLEHDLSVIDYAAAEAVLVRDADRDELNALSKFFDAIVKDDRPAPDLVMPGARWVLQYRNNMLSNARLARRGGDLQLTAAALHWRLGHLDEALERARALQDQPTPQRRLLLAQVLATRGSWAEARKEARAVDDELAPNTGYAAYPIVRVLSTVDDLEFHAPFTREWAGVERATVFALIHGFTAARKELHELEPSRDVLRTEVLVEVLDRNFDGALERVEEALKTTPDDQALLAKRDEIQELKRLNADREREEVEIWAPLLLTTDKN